MLKQYNQIYLLTSKKTRLMEFDYIIQGGERVEEWKDAVVSCWRERRSLVYFRLHLLSGRQYQNAGKFFTFFVFDGVLEIPISVFSTICSVHLIPL